MAIEKKRIYDKIIEWLIKGGFKVAIIEKSESSVIEYHALVNYHANPELKFELIFDKSYLESFIIRAKFVYSKNGNDEEYFEKLNQNDQTRLYDEIQKQVYSMHLDYLKKDHTTMIIKTFFIEDLTRQYFFDSIFDLLHTMKLIQMKYSEYDLSHNN